MFNNQLIDHNIVSSENLYTRTLKYEDVFNVPRFAKFETI